MAKSASGTNLETFAEDLGRLLGSAENKAKSWLSQRAEVSKQLAAIRDKASELLTQLGGESPFPWRKQKAVKVAPGGKRVKRGRKTPMSAAERKAVSERMRKYWADRRKSAKKTTK